MIFEHKICQSFVLLFCTIHFKAVYKVLLRGAEIILLQAIVSCRITFFDGLSFFTFKFDLVGDHSS